ncbi:hypothetical protein M0804_010510 [Polistes exclamans]|nr:hypothetical protein M0804_010510 [Polistes exclamans]
MLDTVMFTGGLTRPFSRTLAHKENQSYNQKKKKKKKKKITNTTQRLKRRGKEKISTPSPPSPPLPPTVEEKRTLADTYIALFISTYIVRLQLQITLSYVTTNTLFHLTLEQTN